MSVSIENDTMIGWLRNQVRIIEAWREEMASRPELDMPAIMRLERHYIWLSAEVTRLEAGSEAKTHL